MMYVTEGSAAHIQCQPCMSLIGAADVQRFSTLMRLTHLDLGCGEGVAALAGQLPCLQSLALHLPHPPATVSAAPWAAEASMPFGHHSASRAAVSCIAGPASTQRFRVVKAGSTCVMPWAYAVCSRACR